MVSIRPIAIASKVPGFEIFALLLWWYSMPREGLDITALLFAAAVFGIDRVCDMYWRPWARKAKARQSACRSAKDRLADPRQSAALHPS